MSASSFDWVSIYTHVYTRDCCTHDRDRDRSHLHTPTNQTTPRRQPQQLACLQVQFLEGKFTDPTIRVTFKDNAPAPAPNAAAAAAASSSARGGGKRRKTAAAAVAAAAPAAPAGPVDIPCHAVVLSARSPYFGTCLGGAWRGAQAKTIELELEDAQGAVWVPMNE